MQRSRRKFFLFLSKWFIHNYPKASPDKYDILLTDKSETQVIVENVSIPVGNFERLLGIKIVKKFSFEPHIQVENSMHCHGLLLC